MPSQARPSEDVGQLPVDADFSQLRPRQTGATILPRTMVVLVRIALHGLMFNAAHAGLVIDQAGPTQTTLGMGLFKNWVDEIVPLGPSDLAGTLQIGDTGVNLL